MQMQAQYASIGWSVGATLGLAAATRPVGRRVVAVVGDGAFQMTAQVLAFFHFPFFLKFVAGCETSPRARSHGTARSSRCAMQVRTPA